MEPTPHPPQNSFVTTYHMTRASRPTPQRPIKGLYFPTHPHQLDLMLQDLASNSQQKFYDKEFPKKMCSVYGFEGKNSKIGQEKRNLEWMKPGGMFGANNYTIFSGETSASQIIQGKLANCWFLSACAALAEDAGGDGKIFFWNLAEEV